MKNLIAFVAAIILAVGFGGAAFAAENASTDPSIKSEQVLEKVNINSADVEALANGLHRVGIKKAEAIVAWRTTNGNFTSVDQLLEVKGIGESILAANRDRITL